MLAVFVGLFCILLLVWFKVSLSYWKRRGVPGPTPWPIVGNVGANFCGKKTLGGVIHEIYKKYEGYPFVGIFRATKPTLLVRDPEFVNRILTKDFQSFRNNEFTLSKEANPLFGHNPFFLKDQEWKNVRQMLTPGMTSGKNIYPIIKQICEDFVKYLKNYPNATDGIETNTLTKRLTLDFVAKSAFGIDGKSFESYDDISDFHKLVHQMFSPGTWSSFIFGIAMVFPAVLDYTPAFTVTREVQTKLMQVISEIVQYRKVNNIQANDYLQFLIELSKERKFGDLEITAHACTFFIDGYETSAIVLSFLLLNLARYPKYQENIRAEIKKYELENDGDLTYEAVHEMPWLNACFYESLRYTPPMDLLTKMCNQSYEYTPSNPEFKKITVKLAPGDTVLLPYKFLCSDEKYFENADKFLPERMFQKDSFEKSTFFPFGDGPRICIGQRLGVMQVKLAVAYILKHFELSISPKLQQPITYEPFHIFNMVKGGFWISYKKIEN